MVIFTDCGKERRTAWEGYNTFNAAYDKLLDLLPKDKNERREYRAKIVQALNEATNRL